jgi:hypothetical protein
MIRVLLRGRTGNSFFQYATARALAVRHGTGVLLDGSWQRNGDWRQAAELKRLNLQADLVRPFPLASKISRKLWKRHPAEARAAAVLREADDDNAYLPAFEELPDHSLLIGYFQTPRYFGGIRGILQHEINFRELPMDEASRRIAEALADPASVSVHVRRGDFLRYADIQICSPDYYRRALDWMRERVPGAVFWIFSDDLDWCRGHFQGPEFRFADAPQSKTDPLNDLRLMSLASHHVIVNSSYSWWAAWLHWHPGKQVILPHAWATGGLRIPIEEKAEDGWIALHGNDATVPPRILRSPLAAPGA